jgi:hypothetical protein
VCVSVRPSVVLGSDPGLGLGLGLGLGSGLVLGPSFLPVLQPPVLGPDVKTG